MVALDFFVVPTVGHTPLFVLVMLADERRHVVHFNITEHPTAEWTAQQVLEAFPWTTSSRPSCAPPVSLPFPPSCGILAPCR